MSSPPSKRQKTAGDAKSPIIFSCPGQKPDVKLVVFDQEYHVHSMLLKLHSAFFRKFLDSADKVGLDKTLIDPASNSTSTPPEASLIGLGSTSKFKYEWVTKIDDDGNNWSLVEDSPKNQPYALSTFESDESYHIDIFGKLLCAIYNRPYQLQDAQDLIALTKFADYYRALPIVSRTLDGAIIRSEDFCRNIEENADELFVASAKLRNVLLFRECLIWVVNPFKAPVLRGLQDHKLRMTARCAYGEISAMVMEAIAKVLRRCAEDHENNWAEDFNTYAFSRLHEQSQDLGSDEHTVDYAWYIRNLRHGDILLDFDIQDLMASKLVLDRGANKAGEDTNEDHFFCATIKDEDLPWDISETDW